MLHQSVAQHRWYIQWGSLQRAGGQGRMLTARVVPKGDSRGKMKLTTERWIIKWEAGRSGGRAGGVAYDNTWPVIWDRVVRGQCWSVISCLFWRQDSLWRREEDRPHCRTTKTKLTLPSPSRPLLGDTKPSHDFPIHKTTLSSVFPAPRPTTP